MIRDDERDWTRRWLPPEPERRTARAGAALTMLAFGATVLILWGSAALLGLLR